MNDFAEQLQGLNALSQVAVPDLWQQQAVSALREGKDVVVQAPTGAGKTLIFESWSNQGKPRGQAIYTVPTRALANDKLAEWRARGWQVGIATGDLSDNLDAPVIVATLETQKHRLIRGEGPSLLVVDEYQMIGDPDRGLNYEIAIAMAPPRTQLLLLSGSVANPQDVVKWLRRLGRNAILVKHDVRPVPLDEVYASNLSYHLPNEVRGYWPRLVAKALAEDLGPVLVFAPRRQASEEMAAELARQLPCPNPLTLTLAQKQLVGEHLAKLLKARVAYHHSGLSYAVRAGVIEPLAKAGQLRAVVATMGLAAGINFSLRSVALAGESYRREAAEQPLRADEILQMFGRAGRRGLDEIGYVLVSANGIRLLDAHPGHLLRSGMVDWSALLSVMSVAAQAGRDPFTEAVRVQERLFTSKPIILGVEESLKHPQVPCGLRTDSERARQVKKRFREMLNSRGEWEPYPTPQEKPLREIVAPEAGQKPPSSVGEGASRQSAQPKLMPEQAKVLRGENPQNPEPRFELPNAVAADVRRLHLEVTGPSLSLPRTGRDGFHSVPDPEQNGDAVERVPTTAFLGARQPAVPAPTLPTPAATDFQGPAADKCHTREAEQGSGSAKPSKTTEEGVIENASGQNKPEEATVNFTSGQSKSSEATSCLTSGQSKSSEATPCLTSDQSKSSEATPCLTSDQSKSSEATPCLTSGQSKSSEATPCLTSDQSSASEVTSDLPSAQSSVSKDTGNPPPDVTVPIEASGVSPSPELRAGKPFESAYPDAIAPAAAPAGFVPILTLPAAIEKVGLGTSCVIAEANGRKLHGKLLTVADRLHDGRVNLAKWVRRLTNWHSRQAPFEVWEKKIQPLLAAKLAQQKTPVIRFTHRGHHVAAVTSIGELTMRVPVDRHGVALWRPVEREVLPPSCVGCEQIETCRRLPTVTGTALLWRRLGLVDAAGKPTRRGQVVSFFHQGDGLAIAVALEDETYALDELVYDLANLDAGFRFAGDENRWAGRLAVVCHAKFGLQSIPGYLENGLPPKYGAGAEQIVAAVHKDPLAKFRWVTLFLGVGDIDRMIIEWRSLLRQIAHAPDLDWPRWTALQAMARGILHETESPTLTELPPLEYSQTRRVDHRLQLRRH